MIVMKFGGTSVGSPERIASVAGVVHARSCDGPVLVVSAMSGVTNELEDLLSLAVAGDRALLDARLAALRERHGSAAAELVPGDAGLGQRLDRLHRELRVLLRGVRLMGSVKPRSRDAILGFGELFSQELVAATLRRAGQSAEVVRSGDILVTDDCFGAATPNLEETTRRSRAQLAPLVERGVVPVLGGYLGATSLGLPTTLGRGGSDLSASVFALALCAEAVEIWTDVDGLMTADPRRVPGARLIETATFREAAELAGYGARVLHPAAIDPAIDAGIPVVVRNSLAPGRPGTRIGPLERPGGGPCAIASLEDLRLISLRAPGRTRSPAFFERVAGVFAEAQLVPRALNVGALGVDFVVPNDEGVDFALRGLAREGRVETRSPVSLVALVGEALSGCADSWSRVLSTAHRFHALRLTQGPQASSIGVVVDAREAAGLIAALHEEWFEQGGEG